MTLGPDPLPGQMELIPRDYAELDAAELAAAERLTDAGAVGIMDVTVEPEPAATAIDVLAVFEGRTTGAEAEAVLASYFASGPEPRCDTPELQAEAEADLEIEL